MTGDEDNGSRVKATGVISFPFSRVQPTQTVDLNEPAMFGEMSMLFGIPREQTTGHWCSFCRRIWYGYLLEVKCPGCGNRHG